MHGIRAQENDARGAAIRQFGVERPAIHTPVFLSQRIGIRHAAKLTTTIPLGEKEIVEACKLK